MIHAPQIALLLGIAGSFFYKNPQTNIWAKYLLQISVVLLGAALNFHSVLEQGLVGGAITFISIALVFLLGFIGIHFFKLDEKQGLLITIGTAICGGSAIAALAPVIGADALAITISMGIVFLLNAIAAFVFPWAGHLIGLSNHDFGMWSALAIHDTSSVVAAASVYGEEALAIASTVKLTRALWIVPITFGFSLVNAKKENRRAYIPWFILGFILMSLAFTFIQPLQVYKTSFMQLSKIGFSITLFVLGLSFNAQKLRQVGMKPLLFGVALWVIVLTVSLAFIRLR